MPGKYEEVAPYFFKFETEGDSVEGVYADKGEVVVGGNLTRRYVLETAEGPVSFLGGAQLDTLMDRVDFMDKILVTFKGTTPTRGGQQVKVFSVGRWTEDSKK